MSKHKKNKQLGTALFWVIKQQVVISYRSFGPIFKGSRTQYKYIGLTPEYGADRLSQNVIKNLPPIAV
jgi:hypothetical protein